MVKLSIVLLVLAASGCAGPEPDPVPPTPVEPDEEAALQAVGDIQEAQDIFMNIERRYALTISELVEDRRLGRQPSAPGYRIRMRASADAASYWVTAEPVEPDPGVRSFFVDETGVVRAEPGRPATETSPPVE